jgi:glycosyltransferase involved in cell wall biosynthesis
MPHSNPNRPAAPGQNCSPPAAADARSLRLMSRRPRVLLMAFACDPQLGSEPEVGWQWVRNIARSCDVWVITDGAHQAAVDAHLRLHPDPVIHMIYHRLARPLNRLQRGRIAMNVYYYLWELSAVPKVRRLHRHVGFDLAQHITYVRYWMPSAAAALDVPFVWGPVGGGESAPPLFRREMRPRHRLLELARSLARRIFEWDPLVRLTARRATVAIAVTAETAACVRRLGVRHVEVLPAIGYVPWAANDALPGGAPRAFRFISIGRLLHWKGVDLAIRAFAAAGLPGARLLIVGDGPERLRLHALAEALGLAGRIDFTGELPRTEVRNLLTDSDVLVHPSLHDSGGAVCLEAMAAAKPIICLDLGGPGTLVVSDCGIRVAPGNPGQAVGDIAAAMRLLHGDAALRHRMGAAGRQHVAGAHSWEKKMLHLGRIYAEVLQNPGVPGAWAALEAPVSAGCAC